MQNKNQNNKKNFSTSIDLVTKRVLRDGYKTLMLNIFFISLSFISLSLLIFCSVYNFSKYKNSILLMILEYINISIMLIISIIYIIYQLKEVFNHNRSKYFSSPKLLNDKLIFWLLVPIIVFNVIFAVLYIFVFKKYASSTDYTVYFGARRAMFITLDFVIAFTSIVATWVLTIGINKNTLSSEDKEERKQGRINLKKQKRLSKRGGK